MSGLLVKAHIIIMIYICICIIIIRSQLSLDFVEGSIIYSFGGDKCMYSELENTAITSSDESTLNTLESISILCFFFFVLFNKTLDRYLFRNTTYIYIYIIFMHFGSIINHLCIYFYPQKKSIYAYCIVMKKDICSVGGDDGQSILHSRTKKNTAVYLPRQHLS